MKFRLTGRIVMVAGKELTLLHSNPVTLGVEKSTDLRHVAVSFDDVFDRARLHQKRVILSEHLCQSGVIVGRKHVRSVLDHVFVHLLVRRIVGILGMGIILSKN